MGASTQLTVELDLTPPYPCQKEETMGISDQFAGANKLDGVVVFDQIQRVLWQDYDGYWECQLVYRIDDELFVAKTKSRRRLAALSFAMTKVAEDLFKRSEEIRQVEARRG